jgi:hypothetical protein
MSSDRERSEWEQGWGGHETQQLERLSRVPLPEKLRWLEEPITSCCIFRVPRRPRPRVPLTIGA